MTAHDQHHDDVLIRLLADADAPAAAGLLEGTELQDCPVCAARLAEVPAVTDLLDTLGRDVRRGLSSAAVPAPPSVEEAFTGRLRGLLTEGPRAAGARGPRATRPGGLPGRSWWLALAAGGLAVLGARLWLQPPAPNEPAGAHVLLGEADFAITVEQPVGEPLVIRWDVQAPRGGAFRLTIWPADGSAPLLRVAPLGEPTWKPNPEEERRLHGDMIVEVELLGPGGTPAASAERAFARP